MNQAKQAATTLHEMTAIPREPGEVWKRSVSLTFLFVSNLGRVWRPSAPLRNKIGLLGFKNSSGYIRVSFRHPRVSCPVHRLVAEVFVPNIGNKPHVNHKDGIKTNNVVGNLEWCTPQENNEHRSRVLKKGLGSANGKAKLDENQIRLIRGWIAEGKSNTAIAFMTGVTPSVIRDVRHGKTWKHVT